MPSRTFSKISRPCARFSSTRPATRTTSSVDAPASIVSSQCSRTSCERVRAIEANRIRIVAAGADLVDLGEPRREFVVHQRFRSKMMRKPNNVSHGS